MKNKLFATLSVSKMDSSMILIKKQKKRNKLKQMPFITNSDIKA